MTPSFDDFTEITTRLYEYSYGIDLRDWSLYRSVFTDEVTMDFSSYNGSDGPLVCTAEEWIAGLKPLFSGLDSTQHAMSNPIVSIGPTRNTASCRMYMQAVHMLDDDPEPEFTIGGYYDDTLVRTDTGWLISGVTLNVWWRRGNADIMSIASERGEPN